MGSASHPARVGTVSEHENENVRMVSKRWSRTIRSGGSLPAAAALLSRLRRRPACRMRSSERPTSLRGAKEKKKKKTPRRRQKTLPRAKEGHIYDAGRFLCND